MNTMKNLLVLVILLLSNVAFAQQTETRKVSSFNKLEAGGSFDVVIEQGDESSITIASKGVDPEKIMTEVKGDVLKVYLEKGNYRNVNATVYITYENLEGISSSGSGNLLCKSDLAAPAFKFSNSGSGDAISEGNIKAEQLSLGISGSGNVELAAIETEELDLSMSGSGNFDVADGSAIRISIDKSGSGNIEASGVESDICAVDMSGSGNVAINANESIEANMSGSGNINYQGDATISKVKVSGSGEINKH